ncbi:MAG TPA: DPP IV N-terminal domain-containing protein [Candidatus Binataceae bacterium]|nr:DPP IV N-terminal domain-containing protein [Candidatus Binataceae bacterium]
MKRLIPALVMIVIACAAAPAPAQPLKMTITGGNRVSNIALSQLKDLGGDQGRLSAHFVSTLTRNLKLSGDFKVLDPASYIEKPQSSGIDVGQINFGDWSSISADFLVKGSIQVNGSQVSLVAMLFDVSTQQRMMGKRFVGGPGDVREMARLFADAVMKSVTGVRGPFNTKLAFVSTHGGRFKEVYVSYLDGDRLFQITNNPTINLFPHFDHSARHLIYLSYKSGEPALYLVDLAAKREVKIQSGSGRMVGGALTPNDQIVAAIESGGYTNLYLLDSAGNRLRALTHGNAINVNPAVSPDGSQLAFCSDRSGRPQIYVMSLTGGAARRVTYEGSYNTSPAFSPDGSKIAYESREGGRFDIYVIPTAGGKAARLTSGGSSTSPSWSPDGRYIVFSSTREGRARIYIMQVDNPKIISALTEDNGNDTSPAWSWWLGE